MVYRWALLALVGCARDERKERDELEDPAPQPSYAVSLYGQAPWDPALVEGMWPETSSSPLPSAEAPKERYFLEPPLVLDGAGAQAPYRPLLTHDGVYAFQPSEPLEPGEHVAAVAADPEISQEFSVLPYGIDPAFDPQAIVGRIYEIDVESAWIPKPSLLNTLAGAVLESLWLTVEEVDGDRARFSIAGSFLDNEPCQAFRAWGDLSPTGALTWSMDVLDLESADGPIPLLAPSFRLGWLPDGSAVGGAEGQGTLHTQLLGRELYPEEPDGYFCGELLPGYGIECYDCRGDGEHCVDIRFHAAVGAPIDALGDTGLASLADLPSCGVDLSEDDAPTYECEFSGGSCAAGVFGIFGLTGALRRRRALTGVETRRTPDR